MKHAQSKRLRFRFFPEDDHALEETLRLTSHTSKSSVIRGALAFFDHVWSSQRGGFRIVYCREGTPERPSVLDSVLARFHAGAREADRRAKTEKSIEVRLTRSDSENIDRLLTTEAADTFSDVIRRAIRLYATAVMRNREGWDVVSISPSGDVLPLSIPGLGTAAGRPVRTPTPEPRPAIRTTVSNLMDVLPQSLVEVVTRLAARENCPPDLLLVDVVRTEALTRLRALEEGLPARRIEPEPPPEPVPAPAPVPEVTADKALIDEVAGTLQQMADNIEKVMQLVGETTRAKGPQAQLSDLLFGMAEADAASEAVLETASPAERVSLHAKQLNERLTALVALTQRQKRGKA